MSTTPLIGALPRRTLTDVIADRLKTHIFRNGLKPGDLIPSETELAEQFEVSRATVRQAVKALEVAGLVKAVPRSGTRVREFDFSRASKAVAAHFHLSGISPASLFEARRLLEQSAMSLVIERITPAQIERLRAIQQRFDDAVRNRSVRSEEISFIDEEFHLLLLESTGNPAMASYAALFHEYFRHPKLLSAINKSSIFDENIKASDEHRQLIEAIKARDVMGAQQILATHLGANEQILQNELSA